MKKEYKHFLSFLCLLGFGLSVPGASLAEGVEEKLFLIADGQTSITLSHELSLVEGQLLLAQLADGELRRFESVEAALDGTCPSTCQPGSWTVFSALTGKPLPGTRLWWGKDLGGLPYLEESVLVADTTGKLEGVFPPEARVRLWAPGHQLMEVEARQLAQRRQLTLQPGGRSEVQLLAAGEPAPGIEVRFALMDPTATEKPELVSGKSDAEGLLSVPGAGEQRPLWVEVVDPRFQFAAQEWGVGKHEILLQPASGLVGRVVRPDGQPIAGAVVEVLVSSAATPGRLHRRHTETAKDGEYDLQGLPAGRFFVRWLKEGHRTVSERLEFSPGVARRRPRTVLARVQTLDVEIADESGNPIVAATVVDEGSGESWLARGNGVVKVAAPDRDGQLTVRAEGFLAETLELADPPPSALRVVLRRGEGARFTARRLEDLAPVRELTIEARRNGGLRIVEQASENGTYVLAGLTPGPTTVVVRAPGLLPQSVHLASSGGVEDLGVLLFSTGATVESTLLAPGGAPVVGARISHTPVHPLGRKAASRLVGGHEVETDSEGWFRISGLEPGATCLRVQSPGGQASALEVEITQDDETLVLPPKMIGEGATLAGTVVGVEETPLAGLSVELRSGPLHDPCLRSAARTDRDGRFDFSAVAPGLYHLVALDSHQLLASQRLRVASGDRLEGIELVIEQVSVSGRVMLDNTLAVGGQVSIGPTDSEMPTPVFLAYRGPGAPQKQEILSDLPSTLVMAVGQDGRFSGAGVLPLASVDIAYRAPSGVTYRRPLPAVTPNLRELELDFHGSGIHGRVVDPDGRPVGATVSLRRGSTDLRQLQTDDSGVFTIPHVPPGQYLVEARSGAWVGEVDIDASEATAPELEIVLRAHRFADLRIQILDAAGLPAAGVLVSIEDSRRSRRVATTTPDGRVEFSGLNPGNAAALVLFPGQRLAPGPSLDLMAGRTSEVVFEEPDWTEVDLELDDPDDLRPLQLRTPGGLATSAILSLAGIELWPDARGVVELPALSEGSWQVGDPQRGFRSIAVRGEKQSFELR